MNALTLLSSDTNTRLSHCAKNHSLHTWARNSHARSPFHVGMFFTWLGFLAPALHPLGALFIPLGLQHPFHQAGTLPVLLWLWHPVSGFLPLGTPSSSYLGFDYTPPCMEALFTLLRFQLSVPAILHTNALLTLLGLQHLTLSCPFTLDAFLHGHPLHCAESSTPFGGDALAWAPIPCVRPPFLLDTLLALLGFKHPMLGYTSMEMPSPFLLGSHTLHWATLPCWQSHPA